MATTDYSGNAIGSDEELRVVSVVPVESLNLHTKALGDNLADLDTAKHAWDIPGLKKASHSLNRLAAESNLIPVMYP